MKKKQLVNCCILWVLVNFLLLLTSCSDRGEQVEMGISPFSYPSHEGNNVVILVGTKYKQYNLPVVSETKPVLLKLDEESLLKSFQQIDDWVFRDMAWNPAYSNQLYFPIFEKLYDLVYDLEGSMFFELSTGKQFGLGIGQLSMLDTNSEDISITISQNVYPKILSCFSWSPDGKILAGLATKKSGSELLNDGELAVSYDGGRTCELTGIEIFGYPVWLNNNELYLRADHANTIVKVSIDGLDFKITDTLVKDFQIKLGGSFQGKPVYIAYPRKDENRRSLDKPRRLFVGDKMICEAESPYFDVFVFNENIVVESDRTVLVYDENLSLCHKRRLGRNTRLLNFQPHTKVIFLLKNKKTVLCYDLTKKEKPHTIFSVGMLDESSD